MSEFGLTQLFKTVGQLVSKTPLDEKDENQEDPLYQALLEAKEEWENARNLFEEVTENDLIDFAIHRLEAAERRYMYLLKLIKEKS